MAPGQRPWLHRVWYGTDTEPGLRDCWSGDVPGVRLQTVEAVVNWRDPSTNLVHTVDYRTNDAWFEARPRNVSRWKSMLCGVSVGITEDGDVDVPGSLVLRPFLHTRDEPTCLGCLVWSPEQYENEADG
jgi:hypothetical protein